MIGFFRHYKKKSQNFIVVREITFAQSLYVKKIIFSNDLSNNLLFRNLTTISEFSNHFRIRQQFQISVSAIQISENLKTISATIFIITLSCSLLFFEQAISILFRHFKHFFKATPFSFRNSS